MKKLILLFLLITSVAYAGFDDEPVNQEDIPAQKIIYWFSGSQTIQAGEKVVISHTESDGTVISSKSFTVPQGKVFVGAVQLDGLLTDE